MKITRREFIALSSATAAVVAGASPSFTAPEVRSPYVETGESVDSIIWHLWDDPRNPAPFGPLFVNEVLPWDGNGYPIVLMRCGWRAEDREFFRGFYDFEWSNLRRDVPDRFWHDRGNVRRYPNVHSYVREQRFGEHPSVMRRRMSANLRRKSGIRHHSIAVAESV